MKTFLKIAILVVVLVVIANEVGRYVQAAERLNDTTNRLSEYAAENGRELGRNRTAQRLAEMGQETSVTVMGYGQDATTLILDTQIAITQSWVVGPILAWRAKKDLSTPYTLSKQVTKPLN